MPPPAPQALEHARPPAPPPPRRRRSLVVPVLSALGVLAGFAAILAGVFGGSSGAPEPVVFRVPGHPTALVASGGRVWVASPGDGAVRVLDAASGKPAGPPLHTGGTPARLALAAGGVWAGDTGGAEVVPLAPAPGAPLPAGPDVADLAVSSGAVWVASSADGMVRAVERDGTRRELRAGTRLVALAADERRVVALDAAGTLVTIDARTRTLSGPPLRVGGTPVDVALAGDAAWIADARSGAVRRIDLATRRAAGPIHVGGAPVALAAGGGDVYVACRGDDSLERVDARTGDVRWSVPLGGDPSAVALDDHYVWVAAGENRVLRVTR